MAITINASTIINNIAGNGTYNFSSSRKKVKLNEDADSTAANSTAFKKALRALKNVKFEENATASAKTKIKKFVDTYNELNSSASKVTTSKKLTKYQDKLHDLIDEYEEDLKKLGITKNSKNELKFDTTDWSDVTADNINKVFSSDSDFLTDAIKYTRLMANAAESVKSSPVDEFYTSTVEVNSNNAPLAASVKTLASVTKNLLNANYTDTNRSGIVSMIEQYVSAYNKTLTDTNSAALNTTDTTYLSSLKNAAANNSAALSAAGITVNSDDSLSFTDTGADTSALETVFGKGAAYTSTANTYSEKLFDSLVKADSAGINVNYYA